LPENRVNGGECAKELNTVPSTVIKGTDWRNFDPDVRVQVSLLLLQDSTTPPKKNKLPTLQKGYQELFTTNGGVNSLQVAAHQKAGSQSPTHA
jgi:hypothetical protein